MSGALSIRGPFRPKIRGAGIVLPSSQAAAIAAGGDSAPAA